MVSPWQSPLPLEEHKTSRVVVYFYHKGLFSGVEFLVFPPNLDPCNFFGSR